MQGKRPGLKSRKNSTKEAYWLSMKNRRSNKELIMVDKGD